MCGHHAEDNPANDASASDKEGVVVWVAVEAGTAYHLDSAALHGALAAARRARHARRVALVRRVPEFARLSHDQVARVAAALVAEVHALGEARINCLCRRPSTENASVRG